MSNKEVINAFVNGKNARSSNGNLKSVNGKLISYYTTIAQKNEDGTFVLNTTKYSVSTSKIQTWTKHALRFYDYKEVTNIPIGAHSL